jgi:2-dehydropantoate 2-reductase
MMNIIVLGTGGVGGYFGAKLHHAGFDVRFLARGKHFESIQSRGLTVFSTAEKLFVPPTKVFNAVEQAGKCDLVLFCVKSYDTIKASQQLIPALHRETVIISLQNGIDNEEKIQSTVPEGIVYGGIAYIYSTITAPGQITHYGGPTKIVFGPPDKKPSKRADDILGMFQKAGIQAELSMDIDRELWKKFIFITAVAGTTAMTRLTLGELLANDETKRLIRGAMQEALSLSKAKGISQDPSLLDTFFETLRKFKNETRSSLYFDLHNENPMEVEALAGTVVRLGKELGIPTPIQQTMYASLLPYHLKHLQLRLQQNPSLAR